MRASTLKLWFFGGIVSGLCLSACGAAPSAPPNAPEEVADEPATEATTDAPKAKAPPTEKPAADEDEAPPTAEKPVGVQPEFKPGMSVDEATRAVPDGVARLNMEPEVLSAPLQNPDLYAPCKPAAAQHFKLRLAVWNGKVVGLDLAVTPKNATLESCLREQLSKLEWKDRVESLNTIEYAY
ncbi:MAG: hypothetical protein SFV15_01365 [Polyangiaceae bacterium]|nr:hypothetical protein [Polyangiaceae bacterium]